MKKYLLGLLILTAIFGLTLPAAYANFEKAAGYSGKCGAGLTWHGRKGGDLNRIFFYKAHFLLSVKDQLGLSDDQVETIKNLMLETKKNKIRQRAENQILEMDLAAKLHSKKIDEADVQKLIDQKYENKKLAAKSALDAYLKLKGTLNDKQWEAVKNLKKEKMSAAKA